MDLKTEVIEVLQRAMHGTNETPAWVTAYQVVNRLSAESRAQLVREHEGHGGGDGDAARGKGAANAVMRVLRDHLDVEITYLDAWHDSQFCAGDDYWVHPGNVTCALYRWSLGAHSRRV